MVQQTARNGAQVYRIISLKDKVGILLRLFTLDLFIVKVKRLSVKTVSVLNSTNTCKVSERGALDRALIPSLVQNWWPFAFNPS